MPGCGKTTLAKQLSLQMGYALVDLDSYIEELEGMSIPNIFAKKGEAYFRTLEKQAVRDSTRWKRTLVACGGGAPCFFNNLAHINQAGLSLYIHVSAQELTNRLYGNGQSKRPLLKDKNKADLLAEIHTKKNQRDPYYRKAHINLKDDRLNTKKIALAIQRHARKANQRHTRY